MVDPFAKTNHARACVCMCVEREQAINPLMFPKACVLNLK